MIIYAAFKSKFKGSFAEEINELMKSYIWDGMAVKKHLYICFRNVQITKKTYFRLELAENVQNQYLF